MVHGIRRVAPVFAVSALAAAVLAGCAPGGDTVSEEKSNKLIEPVARIELGAAPAGPAAAPAAGAAPAASPAATPPAPVAGADGGDGKRLYDSVCIACHLAGVAGAPKFGDKAAWAPRLAAGIDGLVKSVITGKNAMPPKAGNPALTEAQIKAAVEYMIAQVK
ncbi:MAG: hypothetical protein OHK0026_01480 [Rhodocyclaceae bacterium]